MNVSTKLRLKKIINLFRHSPAYIFSDKTYLKLKFKKKMGYKLNLDNPQTYSEKLQWMKLYHHVPEYTQMVDKAESKDFVASKIGKQYIIPTLGIWDNFDDIDFSKLPDQFVLKTTHDSGGVVVCKDKSKLNIKDTKAILTFSQKRDYYKTSKEWPYKNVPHRILAEKYMEDETGELRDFKFFCFDGKVKALFIASDRFTPDEETKFDFFDENFNHLPFTNGHPNASHKIEKPQSFDEMKRLAEILSEGIPHVRVDFYNINGQIYFGEMTFFHWGGMKPFEPIEWDYKFGEWITLPEKKI